MKSHSPSGSHQQTHLRARTCRAASGPEAGGHRLRHPPLPGPVHPASAQQGGYKGRRGWARRPCPAEGTHLPPSEPTAVPPPPPRRFRFRPAVCPRCRPGEEPEPGAQVPAPTPAPGGRPAGPAAARSRQRPLPGPPGR